ncbi:amidase [Corynebacterium sp. TAE3-ERU12]|uniref:amidase n=1 Tax=Corynebacterium sp. TAE3-ERU12 TaxID=2849491 RepID=UPI001C47AF43|nr:amidase [Corynebacterium sp. TAE3-ERU12]MBV7296084.1 amidase [Corynebacterium sp. TAE3-ERU12]
MSSFPPPQGGHQRADAGAAALLAAVAEDRLDPHTLVEATLARLRAAGAGTRGGVAATGVVELLADYATATAGGLADATGVARGDLWGLPVGIKDLFPIAGVACTMGSQHLRHIPTHTAAEVRSVLARGAVPVATTATSELGATAYTEPIGQPAPDNPLFPGRTPGGSSGGSAVAVARGLVPAALASDGGGSIRVPAAATGIIGLKPAHDIRTGVLSATGFLTRSLADCAALHRVRHPSSLPRRRFRVGVSTRPFHAEVEVQDSWRTAALYAADRLSAAGHDVVPLPAPYRGDPHGPEGAFTVFTETITGALAQLPQGQYSPMVQWLRECGHAVSPERLRAHRDRRLALVAQVRAQWPVDIALTPTLAFDPPTVGAFSQLTCGADFAAQTAWTPWATLWNLTGWAGLSIPIPVAAAAGASVHLGAVRVGEEELLQLASDLIDPDQRCGVAGV